MWSALSRVLAVSDMSLTPEMIPEAVLGKHFMCREIGGESWTEQILTGVLRPGVWVMMSPDEEMKVVDLAQKYDRVIALGPRHCIPRGSGIGLHGETVYRLGYDYSKEEYGMMVEEGSTLASSRRELQERHRLAQRGRTTRQVASRSVGVDVGEVPLPEFMTGRPARRARVKQAPPVVSHHSIGSDDDQEPLPPPASATLGLGSITPDGFFVGARRARWIADIKHGLV